MKIILEHENILLLQNSNKTKSPTVKIVPSQNEAIANWNASSRISPVFKIEGFSNHHLDRYDFPGKKYLLFLGPIHPEQILSYCSSKSHIWISHGLYNLLIVPPDESELNKLMGVIKKKKIPFEYWKLQSGVIKSIRNHGNIPHSTEWRNSLSELARRSFPVELREAIREYCPLMASTLSRSVNLPDYMSSEFIETSNSLTNILKSFSIFNSVKVTYQNLSEVLTVNAGLSRYSSQTFAGTSPIIHTECHFWSNSLLGIGTTSIALRNIRSFLDKTLGKSRLPERFEKLKNVNKDIPDLSKEFPPDTDYLGNIKLDDTNLKPLVPLITYFSARDGYRSTQTTISAPLAAVSSCNCPRWSLMTLTHEFSHVIMRAILADIYPDLSNDNEIEECKSLMESNKPRSSLFHEIKHLCLFSAIKMEDADSDPSNNKKEYDIKDILQRKRHDIDETMVHVFDFLYFYGKDVDKYVSGIWASWGVIPNVSTRVPEYVVRTICAVLSGHLRRIKGEDFAKEEVKESLMKLKKSKLGGRYIQEALNLIESRWDTELFRLVRARRQLVKIVTSFIFSKQIATDIRSELKISGGAGRKKGYTLKQGVLELKPIDNPIMFIESFANSAQPSAAISAWIFYVLAFCLED